MNVSLTPELESFIKEQVEAGLYQTASEVVRQGLRLLVERQRMLDDLNRKIDKGLEDAAAGRTHGPEQARALLRARRAARSRTPS